MTLRRTGNVTINQIAPVLETAALEHPPWLPNNALDGGSVNFSKFNNPVIPLSALSAGEDGVVMNQILEDPARNRLLGLAHTRQTSGVNRQLYLWSAPWGHPEGPWTRLNAAAAPFVPLGAGGQFDSANVFCPTGFILGNNLYVAYIGNDNNQNQPWADQHIGLAWGDISQAIPVATKLGQLSLGVTPFYGCPVGLHYQNGTIVLQTSHPGPGGGYMTPDVPRFYYSEKFSANAADWTLDKLCSPAGNVAATTGQSVFGCAYLGENKWARVIPQGPYTNNLDLYQIELRPGDRVVETYLSNICHNHDSANNWFDVSAMFYHEGKWYITCANNMIGPGYQVNLGIYEPSLPLTSYSGDAVAPAQARNEYPGMWCGLLPSQPTHGYRTVANGWTIADFSVARQVSITGTTGAVDVISVPTLPAFHNIDDFVFSGPLAAGIIHSQVLKQGLPSLTASQVAVKVSYPDTGGTVPAAAVEVPEGSGYTWPQFRIWGETV